MAAHILRAVDVPAPINADCETSCTEQEELAAIANWPASADRPKREISPHRRNNSDICEVYWPTARKTPALIAPAINDRNAMPVAILGLLARSFRSIVSGTGSALCSILDNFIRCDQITPCGQEANAYHNSMLPVASSAPLRAVCHNQVEQECVKAGRIESSDIEHECVEHAHLQPPCHQGHHQHDQPQPNNAHARCARQMCGPGSELRDRSNSVLKSMFQSIAINEIIRVSRRHGPSNARQPGQGRGADDDRQHFEGRA